MKKEKTEKKPKKPSKSFIEKTEKPAFVISIIISLFFIFMQIMSAIACVTVQVTKSGKIYGIIMFFSAAFLLTAIILLVFKKRIIGMAFSLTGWVGGLIIGFNLTNPHIVEANGELPTSKFLLCHVFPIFVFAFALFSFVYSYKKQKKEDYAYFMKTKKDSEKYKSILDK